MAEQTVENTTTTVETTAPVTTTTEATPAPGSKEDILSRVSKFVEQTPAPVVEPVDYNSQDLDKLLEGVTDPAIKEQLIKKSKSLESGFGKKFQELSELRKKLESNLNQSQQWTPERVKSLLQDPTFVQAAQSITGSSEANQYGMTEEEYSTLTPTEKAELSQMKKELQDLKIDKIKALQSEEDTKLKSKYQGYNPEVIDNLTSDLINGKIRATREDLWKVYDYDNAIVRAYKAGQSDKSVQNQERLNASTTSSTTTVTPTNDIKRETGESAKSHFMKLAKARLEESKKMAGAQK